MRKIFIYITLLFFVAEVHAQNRPVVAGAPDPTGIVQPVPPAYNIIKLNALRIWSPLVPMTDASDAAMEMKSNNEVRQETSYFDRMGREVQKVKKGVTASGKDIIMPKVFELDGKEHYMYLPYPSSQATGSFRADAFGEQKLYYSSPVINGNRFTGEKVYYSENVFEQSPLNRAAKEMPVGNSWTGSDRGTSTSNLLNTASDQVVVWSIDNAPGSVPVSAGYYPEGRLTKTVSTDAQQKRSIVFKDFEGRIILKKEEVENGQPGYGGWLSTYFIYDDFGLLRFVIPPMATELLVGNWSFTGKQDLIDGLCFYYEYDQYGRMILKKISGAGVVEMVYDNRDRLVFSRDGNQRAKGLWKIACYDNLNRPVLEGLYRSEETRSTLQGQMNAAPASQINITYNILTTADLIVNGRDSYVREYKASNSITFEEGFESVNGNDEFETVIDPTLKSVTTTISTTVTNPLPNLVQANVIPLVYQYYDDYTWSGSVPFNASYVTKPEKGANLYKEDIVKTDFISGKHTGTKVRVLGTDQWLNTTIYYDTKDRVIQTIKDNIGGGEDILTNLYDFNDRLISTYLHHKKPGNVVTPETRILSVNNFDHAGRLKSVVARLNDNPSLERTVLNNTYYETGELQNRNLGGLKDVAYDYYLSGHLKSINGAYVQGSDVASFGEELYYDYGFTTNRFNGEVAGIVWRGDGPMRAYGYEYDPAGRMTKADFSQRDGSGNWGNASVDYSVYGPSSNSNRILYDANGNILQYNQKGLKGTASGEIDALTYQYYPYSNRLKSVTDAQNDPSSTLGDFKEITSGQATDYTYDPNGNVISDENKGISGIVYNELNLPEQISIRGKGIITYKYDAQGTKLGKRIVDNTASPSKETKVDYIEGLVYMDDVLKYIAHNEGRIRVVNKTGTPLAYYYDYFIKDHLGNVRIVYTEQSDFSSYNATMELPVAAKESMLFSNIESSRALKPAGFGNKTGAEKQYAAKLNAKYPDKRIGPSLVLKVMANDTIQTRVSAFFKSQGLQKKVPVDPVPDMLTPLLQAFSNGNGSAGGKTAGNTFDNIPLKNGFSSAVLNKLREQQQEEQQSDRPEAYLNYVLFDEQMNLVEENSGVKQVQNSPDVQQDIVGSRMKITRNGYLYVYTSNESPRDVFFDDLIVTLGTGRLLEETHYYPFGLVMSGLSSTAITAASYPINQIKYNGKELQTKEFSDGFGLDWYDYGARMYDPQVNRWHAVDAASEEYLSLSPYHYSNNNPITNKDVDGNRYFPQSIPWPEINVEKAVGAAWQNKLAYDNWVANTQEGRWYESERQYARRYLDKVRENLQPYISDKTSNYSVLSGMSPGVKMFTGIVSTLVGFVPVLGSTVRSLVALQHGDKKGAILHAAFAFTEGVAVLGGVKTVGASRGSSLEAVSSSRGVNLNSYASAAKGGAADLAAGWQGKGLYTGVDNWRNITIGEGKFVVGGLPGQSNYYTTLSGLNRSGLNKTSLFEGLQVAKHPQFGYRGQVGIYKVTGNTSAAFGTTYANPQFGAGGLPQVFIPDYSGLQLIKTIPLK